MKNGKITPISETNIGIYVWQLDSGEFLADEEFNVLSIAAMRGDIEAMTRISQTARNLGFGEGRPVFAEGYRKITDEEFEGQIDRMTQGLIPDQLDIGNYKDEVHRIR